jgi:hypothetical protein
LDHLVYAIAVHESGQEPPPKEKTLMFPITDSPSNFADADWHIETLSDPVRAAIEAVQPYHRRHPVIPAPLSILRDLENTDKHKLLRLAYAAINQGDLGFIGPENPEPGEVQIVAHPGEIKDGTEIAAFVFSRPQPDMKYDRINLEMVVALWHGKLDPSAPPWTDRSDFSALLKVLADEVRAVIDLVAAVVK